MRRPCIPASSSPDSGDALVWAKEISEMRAMLETLFRLKENGTTVRTELVAGATTYLTMAYIALVNPLILSAAGMDKGAVFVATCLASALATLFMALYANYPLALAPGMGLNAYFTYGVVLLDRQRNRARLHHLRRHQAGLGALA
jgi:xanthine/uracil/vitamin C permease (AzgA family)